MISTSSMKRRSPPKPTHLRVLTFARRQSFLHLLQKPLCGRVDEIERDLVSLKKFVILQQFRQRLCSQCRIVDLQPDLRY